MKKVPVLFVVLLLSVVLLTGCPTGDDPQPPAGGGTTPPVGGTPPPPPPPGAPETTLIIATATPPGPLDPALENSQPASRVTRQIFQTLVYQDSDLNIVPGLAESWEFIDASTIHFTIREGVLFHNGDVLTVDDVVFTLNRAAVAPRIAVITNMIESATAIDERTVEVRTEFPFAPILSHLAHPAAGIVSQSVIATVGDDAHALHPIGTGPFKFERMVAGDRVELVRFEDFNSHVPGLAPGQLPAIERIIFRIIPEASVRAIEVEAGTVHMGWNIAPDDMHRLMNIPGIQTFTEPNLSLQTYLGFNLNKAPFDDIRVRQAIAYAIDIEAIVQAVFQGLTSPATGPLATTVWGANADLEMWPFDIVRARELMAEAGLADGFSTSIMFNEGNAARLAVAEILQAQLTALNIDVAIRIYEMPVYLNRTAEGEHEMFILGWVSVTGDPDYGLYPTFHSSSFGNPGNRTFYHNPRVDYLLDVGREATDPAVRLAAYHEAQQIIRDDVPWVFLTQGASDEAARADVRGFVSSPTGHFYLWTVYIDQ